MLLSDAPQVDHGQDRARFVVDGHLGVLARYLRLMGFDTLLGESADAAGLALTARREHRTLLTRDHALPERGSSIQCCLLSESDPRLQLREVLRRFGLAGVARPFTRCIVCNLVLSEAIGDTDAPAPPTASDSLGDTDCTELQRCAGCGRVYVPGEDVGHLDRLASDVLEEIGATGS